MKEREESAFSSAQLKEIVSTAVSQEAGLLYLLKMSD